MSKTPVDELWRNVEKIADEDPSADLPQDLRKLNSSA
jgi:hypothetical protein